MKKISGLEGPKTRTSTYDTARPRAKNPPNGNQEKKKTNLKVFLGGCIKSLPTGKREKDYLTAKYLQRGGEEGIQPKEERGGRGIPTLWLRKKKTINKKV